MKTIFLTAYTIREMCFRAHAYTYEIDLGRIVSVCDPPVLLN